jgi:2-oxoglutarate ferredoxin oxidoreductase subunit gamma
MSKLKVLTAGHGGQGVLLLGDYIALTAMLEGKHVAYTPSYGPETRGGKAKCYVIISDEEVDNPIAEEPDVELIMNQPSLDFLSSLRPEGLIIYNTSLIDTGIERDDVKRFGIPATEIAENLNPDLPSEQVQDQKMFANAVMFGAFLELCAPQIKEDQIKECLKHLLAGKKESLITVNYLALLRGKEYVRAHPLPNHKSQSPFNCIPSWAAQ